MNVASANWTVMPDGFEAARRQWEYSHAASAALTLIALILLCGSMLRRSSGQGIARVAERTTPPVV